MEHSIDCGEVTDPNNRSRTRYNGDGWSWRRAVVCAAEVCRRSSVDQEEMHLCIIRADGASEASERASGTATCASAWTAIVNAEPAGVEAARPLGSSLAEAAK